MHYGVNEKLHKLGEVRAREHGEVVQEKSERDSEGEDAGGTSVAEAHVSVAIHTSACDRSTLSTRNSSPALPFLQPLC